MKTKILAILLCFVLTIPFLLTSCYGGNWLGDPVEEASFYDKIKGSYKKAEAASEVEAITIDGTYVSSSNGFLFAYADESTDTHAVAKYTVYDIKTGVGIVSVKLEREYTSGLYSSLYKEVSASYGEGFFVIAGTKANDMIEYTVYSKNGNEIIKGTNVSYKILDYSAFIFDKKLYRVDKDGTAELLKDLTDSNLLGLVDNLQKYGDRFLYVNGSLVYVLDLNYNLLYSQHLNPTPSNTYLNTSSSLFYLNNGNILYQENILLCQYHPTINHNEYDYVSGGSCYRVNTYVFNIANGKYTKINLPYLIQSVSTASKYDGQIPYGYENIASGRKINNGEIVYTNGAIYASLLMDNLGKVVENDISKVTVLGENRYTIYENFAYSIYDQNDKLVGRLNKILYANNELIVTPSAIYNHNLEVVYTLDESSSGKVLPNSVLIYFFDSESGSYKCKLLFSDKSSVTIDARTAQVRNSCVFVEEWIETDESGNGYYELTVYSEKGEVLFTNEVLSDFYYEYDGLIRTTTRDGKILIISVK